ncbi:MAG: hypothetical protein DESF_02260 [Desulfovibrio sp.]
MSTFPNTIVCSYQGWWWRIEQRGGDVRAK